MKTLLSLVLLCVALPLLAQTKFPNNVEPSGSNTLNNGSTTKPWSTNFMQRGDAKDAVDVGRGSGTNGRALFYDMSGTKYSQIEAPGAVINTNTHRLWADTNAGVVVEVNTIAGINQLTNIPLLNGQYLTHNGTTFVASNLPASGGTPGGFSGAVQFNEGGVFAGTNRWVYDRTNDTVTLQSIAGGSQLRLNGNQVLELGDSIELGFGVGGNSNYVIRANTSSIKYGSIEPTLDGKYSLGSTNNSMSNVVAQTILAIKGGTNQLGQTVFNNGIEFSPFSGSVLTNIYATSTNLDFAATTLGAVQDIPVYLLGAADGDGITVTPGLSATTNVFGSYGGFGSNNYVYVRWVPVGTLQNPGAGNFRIEDRKWR